MTARRFGWFAAATAIAVIAVLVMVAVAPAADAATAARTRRITVSATGKVTATPDVADVTMGVAARGRTAADALGTANDRAAKVTAALKDTGITEDDLQTTSLSIQPTYDGDTITGYEASNTVVARLRDLARAGEVLDATARVAGDEIRLHGISFTIDDDSDLLATARARAVKRARAQAEQLADAAGVSVGDVVSIDESVVAVPYDFRAADAAATAAVPIEPGTQTLTIQVAVAYAIG